jgi:hypothetical protein
MAFPGLKNAPVFPVPETLAGDYRLSPVFAVRVVVVPEDSFFTDLQAPPFDGHNRFSRANNEDVIS